MGKKIWQYPEATEIQEGDYALIDSVDEGSRKIPVSMIKSKLISKTVTERKTYKASEDDANGYSEVNVEVPFTNIHVKSGDIVSFDDGEDLPLAGLKVGIEPLQSGSGDPSPSNVRPISGWTGCNLSVVGDNWGDCADIPEPLTANKWYTVNLPYNTYTISFDVVNAVRTAVGDTYVFAPYDGTTNTNILASKIYSVEDGSTYQSKGANISGRFYFTYTGKIKSLCCFWRSNSYQTLTSGSLENIMIEVGNNPTKQFKPYNGQTYTIDLDGTRYGGVLDVVSGVLTVTHEIADLPSLGWGKSINTANIYFYVLYTSGANGTYNDAATNVKSNIYTPKSRISLTNVQGTVGVSAEANALYIADGRFDDYTVAQFKEAMSDVQLLLPLATPLTIQLTPTQVKSLLGSNNVWGDCGSIKELAYQTIWNGENSDSIERLCYVEYVGRDTEEIPTISTKTDGSNYSEYLSYSSSTKKFTVLQSFNALVVPWVYQYDEAQSTRAKGQFFINNTKVIAVQCGSTLEGEYAGKAFAYHFSQGDTFYNYTPSSDGFPQQFLKVYNITGISVDKLQKALDYINETT